ncbi:ankyrin repeat domain-containing protein 49 [Eucyclogobius newberryi]|uniref:ankyrin repeat domain-containing protein 49 n=1 Tax=Eucyclogobius newberryi TaxID=166745 RepID=UPI003B5AEDA1
MEFPEDFNQLELLDTHGQQIPRGTSSLWTGSDEEEEEEEDEEEGGERPEEWYLQKESSLQDQPQELLLWAAENNRVSTVKSLLATDATLVSCSDEDGYTPLHRAAYGGHVDVASALLHAGSRVNARTADGWSPLHSACRWSRVSMASLLLRHGAQLNAQTNGGLTPLHLAASNPDSAHTLELLLSQRHLNASLCSSSAETAGQVAQRSGPHHYLFEMVEECVSVTPSQT